MLIQASLSFLSARSSFADRQKRVVHSQAARVSEGISDPVDSLVGRAQARSTLKCVLAQHSRIVARLELIHEGKPFFKCWFSGKEEGRCKTVIGVREVFVAALGKVYYVPGSSHFPPTTVAGLFA